MPGWQQQEAPHSRSAPNETNWQGRNDGIARIEHIPEGLGVGENFR